MHQIFDLTVQNRPLRKQPASCLPKHGAKQSMPVCVVGQDDNRGILDSQLKLWPFGRKRYKLRGFISKAKLIIHIITNLATNAIVNLAFVLVAYLAEDGRTQGPLY